MRSTAAACPLRARWTARRRRPPSGSRAMPRPRAGVSMPASADFLLRLSASPPCPKHGQPPWLACPQGGLGPPTTQLLQRVAPIGPDAAAPSGGSDQHVRRPSATMPLLPAEAATSNRSGEILGGRSSRHDLLRRGGVRDRRAATSRIGGARDQPRRPQLHTACLLAVRQILQPPVVVVHPAAPPPGRWRNLSLALCCSPRPRRESIWNSRP